MPPRTSRKNKDEDTDFDILASQPGGSQGSQESQGDGSDDNALQLAFAEQLLTSKAQKKKENQQKFVTTVRRGVRTQLTTPVQTLNETKQSVEELLQAFIINRATEEDNIRRIWEEIIDEERKLEQLFSGALITNKINGTECEQMQVSGLGSLKTVCLEYQRVIDWLDPTKKAKNGND
ncbi:hypothetical protein Moror_370 [Moniliophthora roreri MCA 2997]|uniref:Uncharacterized protein n=1 Tax=Moniliophthora roreri (strain MCA 2997) TaxID=1381753 RepID=V2Z2F0_MONRO|nr:hypothetical protein Moror_370 [Moniliophthora roreri MCA 2997]